MYWPYIFIFKAQFKSITVLDVLEYSVHILNIVKLKIQANKKSKPDNLSCDIENQYRDIGKINM